MKIIGLGHYSRVGKDTLAGYLKTDFFTAQPTWRVKVVSFAWKLKDVSHQLYAWAGLREPEFYETVEGAKQRDVRLPALGMTPVEIWVAVGTPAIRERVYDRTWIDYVMHTNHACDVLIIPDVRFMNEVNAVTNAGGLLVKVVRAGYGPRNTVADQALVGFEGWDLIAGPTLSDLQDMSEDIVSVYCSGFKKFQRPDDRAAILSHEVINRQ